MYEYRGIASWHRVYRGYVHGAWSWCMVHGTRVPGTQKYTNCVYPCTRPGAGTLYTQVRVPGIEARVSSSLDRSRQLSWKFIE